MLASTQRQSFFFLWVVAVACTPVMAENTVAEGDHVAQPVPIKKHEASSDLELGSGDSNSGMLRRESGSAASDAEDQKMKEVSEKMAEYDVEEKKMNQDIAALMNMSKIEKEDSANLDDAANETLFNTAEGAGDPDKALAGDEGADAEIQKKVDSDVFEQADADKSNHLEEGEIKKVMSRAGVHPSKFDWKSFDHDKDGRLSKKEFLDAGSAAAKVAVPPPLSMLEEHVARQSGPGALLRIGSFENHDTDGSGSLEEDEAGTLMKRTGADESSWRALDHDGDGALSRYEFERPAEADKNLEDQPDSKFFDDADINKDKVLDDSEMGSVVSKMGLDKTNFDWHAFDHDKDGALKKDEFFQAGPAAAAAANAASTPNFYQQEGGFGKSLLEIQEFLRNGEGELSDEAEAMEGLLHRVNEDFESYDADHSGFLEESEVEKFGEDVGFPKNFDWRIFDTDNDFRLNRDELWHMANGGAKKTILSAREEPSFVEEDEEDEGDSISDETGDDEYFDDAFDEEAVKEDFKESDADHSGFLEEPEINALLSKQGIPDHEWRKHDENHDGKLSEQELSKLAQALVEEDNEEK